MDETDIARVERGEQQPELLEVEGVRARPAELVEYLRSVSETCGGAARSSHENRDARARFKTGLARALAPP